MPAATHDIRLLERGRSRRLTTLDGDSADDHLTLLQTFVNTSPEAVADGDVLAVITDSDAVGRRMSAARVQKPAPTITLRAL